MLKTFFRALVLFSVFNLLSFETLASRITLLENTSFVRAKGKPKVETVQFSYQEGDNFQLTLFNGGENHQYCRISSAVIELNGQTVFSQSDFNQQVFKLTFDVELQENNTLSVKLTSKPDCGIELNVNGEEPSPALVITSSPITQTIRGELYQYTLATNLQLDWDNASVELITAPTGMTVINETITWTPNESQVSLHEITLQIIDAEHGIAEQSFELNVISANQAPIAKDVAVNSAEDQPIDIQLTAIDPNNDSMTFELLSAPEHGTVQQNGAQITFTPVDNFFGNDSFEFIAKDDEFTSNTATVTIEITGENDTPVIVSAPLLSVLENNQYRYLVEAIDVDDEPSIFALLQNPEGMSIDSATGELTWLPSAEHLGEHTITIEVADPFGATSEQSYLLQVVNVNDAPSITSTPMAISNEDEVYLYQVVANDPDIADTLIFSLDIAPVGMVLDAFSGQISWTPNNSQVGSHNVTLLVSDAGGLTASQSFVLVVNNVNDAPTITSRPILEALEDAQYQYQIVVSDEDIADTISYALNSAPEGVIISSGGLVEWLPEQEDVGTVEVSIKVLDKAGLFEIQTYNVTVVNVNDAPVFTPVDTQTVEATQNLTIELSATDEDGDILSYSVINAPEGVTIDGISGVLNWTALVEQVGQYAIEVGVSDGAELVTSEFIVTVEPPLYANPEFIDEVQLVGFVGQNFTHAIEVTTEATVELSLLSAPEGLSLNTSSEELRWLPVVAGKYTVEVAAHITEEIATSKVYQITILEKASNHEGDDFWLTFSSNIQPNGAKLLLYISSPVNTSGVVEAPLQNLSFPYDVTANQVTVVELPSSLLSPYAYNNTIVDNGIHVTSEDDVTVYALNFYPSTTDGFLVLPTESLGTKHYAMTYGADQISVVATQDNTQVDITFAEDTEIETGTKYSKGEVMTVSLNKGQTFNALKWGSAKGLAGSNIDSNLPVAVFSGARCTFVPVNVQACDHLVEQLQDVKYWGQTYYSVPFANRFYGELFQVVAAFDDTRVSINGEYLMTLDKGEWLTDILESASVITASHPIQVAQFSQGASIDGGLKSANGYSPKYGDPFMLLLTPTSQNVSSYIFSTTDLEIENNYVNVVIEKGALSTLRLDDQPIDISDFTSIDNTSLFGGQLEVLEGTHTLAADTNFSASIYGFGDYYNSYGYQGGISLGRYVADTQITLNGNPTSISVGQQLCFTMQVGNVNNPLQKARLDIYSQNSAKNLYHHYSNVLGQAEHCHYGLNEGLETITIRSGEVTTSIDVNWLAPQGDGNQPPVIVSTPYVSAQVNKPYHYELIAIDRDPMEQIKFSLLDSPTAMALDDSTITWTPTLADIGVHSVTVQAMDSSGITSELTFALKVYLGNQPPALVKVPDNKVLYIGRWYNETFQFTDPDDRLTYCQLISSLLGESSGRIGASQTACNNLLKVNLTEEHIGSHPVTIRLWDQAGGESSYSYTVEVRENHLPEVVSEPTQFAKVGETYLSSLVMSDLDGDTLKFGISYIRNEAGSNVRPPLTINELTGELSWEPTSNDVGKYTVGLRVQDIIDTLYYEYPLTVSLPIEPLNAQLQIAPLQVITGEIVTLSVFTQGGVGEVTYQLSVNGQLLTTDLNDQFVYADTEQAGIYTVMLIAKDEVGNEHRITNYFTVIVDDNSDEDVVLSADILVSDQFAVEGELVTLQVVPTNAIAPLSVSLTLDDHPLVLDENYLVQITATEVGLHALEAIVTDTYGSVTVNNEFFVRDPAINMSPIIESSALTKALTESLYQYKMVAVDPEGGALNYMLAAAPSNMTIDQVGLITWQASEEDIGLHNVIVDVSDSDGAVSQHIFNIAVTAPGKHNRRVCRTAE
ncbi:hypothetical protein NBRC116592_36070 [Colwellia sp. KU-HH00111]|uniref:putative Ig domain-containing protein n=1 Tax=Colwellia sp. KU-HH00111 TaxID=3127652 RepID=UPI003106D3FC